MLRRLFSGALLLACACTAPDYKFTTGDGGAALVPFDAGPKPDDATTTPPPSDAGGDAEPPTPRDDGLIRKLPIALEATDDLANDCAKAAQTIAAVNTQVVLDETAVQRCTLYFFANTWRRGWEAAKTACTQITHGQNAGTLAIFLSGTKATNVNNVFPASMTPWIGLTVAKDGLPPSSASNWSWIDGQSALSFNGFAPGRPVDGRCANWQGNSTWGDLDCATEKGFLCEVK